MQNVNREELAWAAGFFDGEGSTWKRTNTSNWNRKLKYPSITMEVAQSGEYAVELLERFQRAVGLGKIYGPYYKSCAKQPIYRWTTQNLANCQAVYAKLWCFLGPCKRQQIINSVAPTLEYYRA